ELGGDFIELRTPQGVNHAPLVRFHHRGSRRLFKHRALAEEIRRFEDRQLLFFAPDALPNTYGSFGKDIEGPGDLLVHEDDFSFRDIAGLQPARHRLESLVRTSGEEVKFLDGLESVLFLLRFEFHSTRLKNPPSASSSLAAFG